MPNEIQSPGQYFWASNRRYLSVWYDVYDGLDENVCNFNANTRGLFFGGYEMPSRLLPDFCALIEILQSLNP